MGWVTPGAAAAAALLVLAGVVGSALGVDWIPGWAAPDAREPVPLAQAEPMEHAANRCVNCGWIESKREILPGLADLHALQVYEYTLRMPDGTGTTFRETLPASWRVGERVRVIPE